MPLRIHVRQVLLLLLCCCGFRTDAASSSQVRPWNDYRTIMWISDSAYKRPEKVPLFFDRLREMGINTGLVHGDAPNVTLLSNRMPYYVENIVNRGLCLKFNSTVRDWNQFITTWSQSGRPEGAFVRDYSLDDPQWLRGATQQMHRVALKNRAHAPVAYDIRDELSVTISANPFDYDFSASTLASFRSWLADQYKSVDALNQEWGTTFRSWDEVRPFTTDQIKNRMASGDAIPRGQPDWGTLRSVKLNPATARQAPMRWNFAPWCDFRTYIDRSLARVLSELREAAHAADPQTPVGIEGTQMPSAWGGYDLWQMSQVLDWVEPYDIGNAREIFGSFMAGKPIVTTVFEKDTNAARRRLWHLLLEGDRGCLIWWSEDCVDTSTSDYRLTPKARALAPVLEEMTSPLAALFLRARREVDPIFVHYSQSSIQVDWLLESTVDGASWVRRFSSFEAQHNEMAKDRNGWLKAFQDLGWTPQFLSSAQLEAGDALQRSNAVLVLPQSLALSDSEVARVKSFSASNDRNVIFTSGSPGVFNEHGRLLRTNRFGGWFNDDMKSTSVRSGERSVSSASTVTAATYARERMRAQSPDEFLKWMAAALPSKPPVSVPTSARLRTHRFRLNDAQLFAFERNVDYHMSEDLKQQGGNEALEIPVTVTVTFPHTAHLYDLRTQAYLGHTNSATFTVNPWQPSLFAMLPERAASSVVAQLGSDPGK